MSNAHKSARPTADNVDPATPVPTPEPEVSQPVVEPSAADQALVAQDQLSGDDELTLITTGPFVLMDPMTGKHFDQETPTTTIRSEFVKTKLASGQLTEA